jgi:hypothetical protein
MIKLQNVTVVWSEFGEDNLVDKRQGLKYDEEKRAFY